MRTLVTAGALVFSIQACSAQGAANPPAFAVASVKPSQRQLGPDGSGRISFGPAGLRGRNVTLKHLIAEAYGVQPYQIFGGPNWLDIAQYDVDARADGPIANQQAMPMLRTLLGDRFQLSLHSETRELRVYDLVVDKHGPKLRAATDAEVPTGQAGAAGPAGFHGNLQEFANLLSIQLSIPLPDDPTKPGVASGHPVPVRDKTGLAGIYDIGVEVRPEPGAESFTLWQRVLQDQLGLKLESRKAEVDVLVIDHAERVPTGN
jgi:uncharacterized protein (TIGR03435 family)